MTRDLFWELGDNLLRAAAWIFRGKRFDATETPYADDY